MVKDGNRLNTEFSQSEQKVEILNSLGGGGAHL